MKISDAIGAVSKNIHPLDARMILSFILKKSPEFIILNPNLVIAKEVVKKFFELANERFLKKPISQIIGKREFYGREFYVNEDVLDPRPDSESLIELALKLSDFEGPFDNILDLGIGSGCLILTLLSELKNTQGIGIDISDRAILVAKENAKSLNLENRVNFINSNWFDKVSSDKKFDLIISNPPYIISNEIQFLQEEVRNFEPRIALDGGNDGLDCYRNIAKDVKKYMKKNSILIVEIGIHQFNDVIAIFGELLYIEQKLDFGGIVRAIAFKNM